ncbi:MAG: TetR/AcrR family transcriptional regulator [Desulfatibacillum sp.]|nr:TetR/AcrR family transcriptional regulator [Desulfatibacillum sp.]
MNTKSENSEIQDMVMQKAAELIAQRGPKRWSTAELAKECGLAKNTLYKIIGSKEQLVETIVLDQIDMTTHMLKAIIREEDGYMAAAIRMVKDGPAYLSERPRVMFPEIFLEYPLLGQKAQKHLETAAAEILQFMRQGQAEGYIRKDAEPEFLYDLVRGIVEHYTRSGLKGASLSSALSKAFKYLREGIRLGDW